MEEANRGEGEHEKPLGGYIGRKRNDRRFSSSRKSNEERTKSVKLNDPFALRSKTAIFDSTTFIKLRNDSSQLFSYQRSTLFAIRWHFFSFFFFSFFLSIVTNDENIF